MRHLMSTACREGARYGTRYTTDALGNRVLPMNLAPSIANYVKQTPAQNGGNSGYGLDGLLPADANATVTVTGPGITETQATLLAGEDLVVTVNARKTWFVIGSLIPGLGSYENLSVNSTMKCE
jgi:hypothetical protein